MEKEKLAEKRHVSSNTVTIVIKGNIYYINC